MIPEYIHGAIAPVFTIFDSEGRLDDAGQRRFLDYMIQAGGVSAYFIRCGMGQMFTFQYEDVKQITKNVCKHMAGKAPILLGTSGIWDRNYDKRPNPDVFRTQAVELSLYAQELGADAVVHTMPEALVPRPGQSYEDLILDYFHTVSQHLKVPVMLYQSPGTKKEYCLTVDLARKLAEMPGIAAVKVSTDSATYILDLCWAVRDEDFAFITGCETAFIAGLASGSKAVIGQGATLNPRLLALVQENYEKGDMREAISVQRSVNYLVEKIGNSTEFFKRYVTEKGYPVSPFRRGTASDGYSVNTGTLTDHEYTECKKIFEDELAKYPA